MSTLYEVMCHGATAALHRGNSCPTQAKNLVLRDEWREPPSTFIGIPEPQCDGFWRWDFTWGHAGRTLTMRLVPLLRGEERERDLCVSIPRKHGQHESHC